MKPPLVAVPEPELDIEIVPDDDTVPPQSRYEWTSDPDEQVRAFIFEHAVNSEVSAKVAVENMQIYFRWIRTGKKKAELKDVKGG